MDLMGKINENHKRFNRYIKREAMAGEGLGLLKDQHG